MLYRSCRTELLLRRPTSKVGIPSALLYITVLCTALAISNRFLEEPDLETTLP